jgi:hypothetical protein
MVMGALSGRLGTRFLVVTVLPNALLLGYIGLLLAAGTPTQSPSPSRAITVLDHLTGHEVAAIVLGLLVFSVATYPLQTPLIQLLEGYWWGLPFGPELADRATERFRKEWDEVRDILVKTERQPHWDWIAKNAGRNAQFRSDLLPRRREELLPTALGNALRRGEGGAGERYRLDTQVAVPRLTPLLAPGVLGELNDLRNQLDAAARLCVAAGVATAASVGLLLRHGPWLFLGLAMYLLTWACYRSSVAAARRFSLSLAAAIDLYHLKLYDALSLERPADLEQERNRNDALSRLFSGRLADEELSGFKFLPPQPDTPAADQGKPGATAPPGQQ